MFGHAHRDVQGQYTPNWSACDHEPIVRVTWIIYEVQKAVYKAPAKDKRDVSLINLEWEVERGRRARLRIVRIATE